jgi:hypothetical protein
MPEVELMLVYMDEALAMKILAPVGMKSVSMSFIGWRSF